jgi:sulfur carrier protein ThiS
MITQLPEMQMVIMHPSDCLIVPSNIGSTANKEHYVVDDIVGPSACSLVISYGITNVRTIQVAIGFAISGREFHDDTIPNDYARVEVLTVVEGQKDD